MQTQSIQNTLLNNSVPTGQKRAEGDLDFKQALARQVERQPLPQPIKVPMKSAPMTKPAPTAQAQPSKPATPNPAAKTNQANAANQSKPAQQAKAADAPDQAQQADAADSTNHTAAADATAAAATAQAAAETAPEETAAQPADAAAAAAAVDPMANMLAMIAAYNQQTQPVQPADGTAEAPAGEGDKSGDPLAALQDETSGKGGKPDAGLGADAGGKGKADAAALPGADAKVLDAGKLELSAGAVKTEMKAEAFAAKLADAAAATQPVLPQATQTLVATAQAADVAASNQLQARVGSDAWEQQLGQKVVWMVAGGDQSASLTLNPPDLGPLQIVLNVSNDQASVSFMAAEPETRQALEDAMPKLRETMGEAGIQLGDTSVSTGSQDQRQAFAEQAEARAAAGSRRLGNGGGEGPAQTQPEPVIRRTVLGAVDTFA